MSTFFVYSVLQARGSSMDLNMSAGSAAAELDSPRGGRTSTPTHTPRRHTPFRPATSSSPYRPRSPFALTREVNIKT